MIWLRYVAFIFDRVMSLVLFAGLAKKWEILILPRIARNTANSWGNICKFLGNTGKLIPCQPEKSQTYFIKARQLSVTV